jgi:glutamyl-tRNA synthetase
MKRWHPCRCPPFVRGVGGIEHPIHNGSQVNRTPSQLKYWQKEAVQALPLEESWQWLKSTLKTIIPEQSRDEFLIAILPNIYFPSDALTWAKIFFKDEPLTYEENPCALIEKGREKEFIRLLKHAVSSNQDIVATIKQALKLKGRALFAPIRVIFTGKVAGPELKSVLSLIPKAIKEKRIEAIEA